MSEETPPKPIKKADLARRWGVSPPYLTKLVKTKAMPAFTSYESADDWRALNAPPKASRTLPGQPAQDIAPEKMLDRAAEKIATQTTTTTPAEKEMEGLKKSLPANTAADGGAEIIDVTKFITRGVDFDELMIRQAEGVPQVAHGLYERACNAGKPDAIAANLKNWHEASKAAAGVREKFLDIQERTRALIPLDEVMDVVGMELQPARTAMIKLGERIAAMANPSDPALARAVIDAAVDMIFRQFDNTLARAQKELAG